MLSSYFSSVGFTQSDIARILEAFHKREFTRGDFFIEEGKTSKHLGFVEKGLFQYYILVDGEERTTYAVYEGNFLASLVSLFKQVPARETIRAVTDSVVWMVEKPVLDRLQHDVPSFKDFYIGLLEWQIGCIDDSRLDAITLNAEQRYRKLLADEPHLLQLMPLQYLASILGVTPRHLSRIRKNIR
jgi:CRP-like cAMP-binding protein